MRRNVFLDVVVVVVEPRTVWVGADGNCYGLRYLLTLGMEGKVGWVWVRDGPGATQRR